MTRRAAVKLVGAALSAAVATGCTTTPESRPSTTPLSQEQVDARTPEERFIEAGRYMANTIMCIANDERSEMLNLDEDQLDNAAEVTGSDGRGGAQPVHVNVRRGVNRAGEGGSWSAHYRIPPIIGGKTIYAMQVRGSVPSNSSAWKSSDLLSGQPALGLEQADVGAAEVVPEVIGALNPAMGRSVSKRGDRYYYELPLTPPHSGPLNTQEFSTFLAESRAVADELLRLSGINPAACHLD